MRIFYENNQMRISNRFTAFMAERSIPNVWYGIFTDNELSNKGYDIVRGYLSE